jgi:hypothetical protein
MQQSAGWTCLGSIAEQSIAFDLNLKNCSRAYLSLLIKTVDDLSNITKVQGKQPRKLPGQWLLVP